MALQRELWSSREQMIAEEKAMLQTLVFHSLPPHPASPHPPTLHLS